MACRCPMWMWIVTLLVINLSTVLSCSPQYGYRLIAFENKKVFGLEMWTLSSMTKAECLSRCFNESYCMSVHYIPSEQNCIALRERFDETTAQTIDVPGYTLYQTGKPLSEPGAACELDVDCLSLANSHCHQDQCRCDVGYEPTGRVCRSILDCLAFNDTFTKYDNIAIEGNNYLGSRPSYDRPGCQAWCAEQPECKSADFEHNGNICYLNDKSWLEALPGERNEATTIHDFYQRGCLTWT